MEKIIKWKYQNRKLNSLNEDDLEMKELSEIIDTANKDELKEIFDIGLKIKYDLYKNFLSEYNLFLFKDLQENIKDSVNCLIIGAYIPSITNTNLLLERAIKLALIQFEAGTVASYDDEIIKKYIDADKQYAGKNMEANIQRCVKYKILNVEEAKELTEYKVKFRDGFSHFTPKNIMKGESSLINIPLGKSGDGSDKVFKTPIYQSIEVRQFAINNAAEHLNYVLNIVNHLQWKVVEKFNKQ